MATTDDSARVVKWSVETRVDEFDDSVDVLAQLIKLADSPIAGITVACDGGDESLTVHIIQSERLRDSLSEEVAVRFGDEAPETLSVSVVHERAFLLASNETYKKTGNYDGAELARRLTRHGKFRLRYGDITLTFRYDIHSATQTIGKALKHCGVKPQSKPFDWFGLFD